VYDPLLYEAIHRGSPGDSEFYRRLCQDAGSVLELGCGYGRVLAALVAPGRTLVGLDIESELLASAARKLPGVKLVEGDMSDFDLGQRFDRVLIAHSGIFCLDSPRALRSTFACAARHLEADGRLAFDFWTPDAFHEKSEASDVADDQLDPLVTVEVGNVTYDVLEKSRWNRENQLLHATYVHQPRGEGEAVEGHITHRYFLRPEMEQALAETGFEALDWHGGFADEPWSSDAESTVVVARKCGP